MTPAGRSPKPAKPSCDANLLDRNQRRVASLVETGKVKKRDRDYRPAAGTVLVRDSLATSALA
jgi:hypothetical protein